MKSIQKLNDKGLEYCVGSTFSNLYDFGNYQLASGAEKIKLPKVGCFTAIETPNGRTVLTGSEPKIPSTKAAVSFQELCLGGK